MKKINKLLIRDLNEYRTNFVAIAVVIFIGITLFSACVMAYRNLTIFRDDFYDNYQFLDAYVEGINISNEDIEAVLEIEGVAEIERRLVLDGLIVLPDNNHHATATVIAHEQEPNINQLRFNQGRYLEENEQAILSKSFAEYNDFIVGNNLTLRIDGQERELEIFGIVESPEFIFMTRSRNNIMPSIMDYGIIYISHELAREMLGLPDNFFNQLHLIYEENVNTAEVSIEIERILGDRFISYTERETQISAVLVQANIEMLADIAYMFPIMFLSAAALVIFVVQRKLIYAQKTIIGVMKAMGYSNQKLLLHYIKQSVLISTIASLLAIIPSYYLSIFVTNSYASLVYIPINDYHFNWYVIGVAVVISNLFSITASFFGVRSVIKMSAMEAMRPTTISTKTSNVQLFYPSKRLKLSSKLAIRNLSRNPIRSLFVIICYTIAFTLFSAPLFLHSSVRHVAYSQYSNIQSYDYQIVLNQPVSIQTATELIESYQLENTMLVLELPIRIENNGEYKLMRLIAFSDDYTLHDGRSNFDIPTNGILLPQVTVNQLSIDRDNEANLQLLDGSNQEFDFIYINSFRQFIGYTAYTRLDFLIDELGITEVVNAINVVDEELNFSEIRMDIELEALVSRVDSVETQRAEFNTLLGLVNIFVFFMTIFGLLMGGSSFYNATMINVLDKKKEWGILKILGYSNSQILKISIKEIFISLLVAIIPCVVFGTLTSYILGVLMGNQFYTSPFILEYGMFIYPLLFCLVLSVLSIGLYYLNIKAININDIAKTKE